jgi:hypothetical protein
MFSQSVGTVVELKDQLTPNWQYRGESFFKPKSNALAYERIPKGGVILFDVLKGEEDYLSYEELKAEGDRLGLEVVPQLYTGSIRSADELRKFLDTVSILGGQKIEGVVIKPLSPLFGLDKKVLFGKFVSEAFKEVHKEAWGESNPSTGDIISNIVKGLRTQTRWNKCIQHLREQGILQDAPQDIGPLMKEIPEDIHKECKEEIMDALWKYAWPHIRRQVATGFPQYYKDLLLALQFEKEIEDGSRSDDPVVGDPSLVTGVASDPAVAGV